MASVLYDLHMIRWLFCLAGVRGGQKWGGGAGVVKNLEPGVILAEGKSYLFSPVRDKRDHSNNCVNLRTELFVSSARL